MTTIEKEKEERKENEKKEEKQHTFFPDEYNTTCWMDPAMATDRENEEISNSGQMDTSEDLPEGIHKRKLQRRLLFELTDLQYEATVIWESSSDSMRRLKGPVIE
ncbi:hypothetical protein RB195_020452 [Necator americanus]|uniref:Uncharacterized protein n=1 Tax=Necator americanus TaxID=51031 RepID=A0ABR1CLN7_NECAM